MTIELRPDGEQDGFVYLDELVGSGCSVHLERMDEHWYSLVIEDGERRVMLNVGTAQKYRRKVNAKVYADEPVTASSADEVPHE